MALAKEKFDIELKGKDEIVLHTAKGTATLYFLSNNSKSAQSYHGHVYIDEYFWITKFNELFKVATGMAAHKKWRRTFFSTPSAVTHEAYDLWTGDRFNKRWKRKSKRVEFPSFDECRAGAVGPDKTWRKVITLLDAEAGGCDLFDIDELRLEYSDDEFKNLFMCQFVDDLEAVFRLHDLEACYADFEDWTDFDPVAERPFGNRPVVGGYDPSRHRDDASFVILAPPLKDGGEFRVLARYKWVDKSFTWQAERIKELTDKYNFVHIGVDTTGPGMGVFDIVKAFFPAVMPIHYSVQAKTALVLQGQGRHRVRPPEVGRRAQRHRPRIFDHPPGHHRQRHHDLLGRADRRHRPRGRGLGHHARPVLGTPEHHPQAESRHRIRRPHERTQRLYLRRPGAGPGRDDHRHPRGVTCWTTGDTTRRRCR